MFGDLPKLFGREFAIGFLLPVAVFIPSSLLMISSFDDHRICQALKTIKAFMDHQALFGASLCVFLLWLGAVSLLALNRAIIRTKEGYGENLNPAQLFSYRQRRRFRRLRGELQELFKRTKTLQALGQELDPASERRRDRIARSLAKQFPHTEALLLPTAFGNTIRAFEIYSSVMYGLDSIPGWSRLLMVMPTSSRSLIDSAKAEMDFWLNLWFLSLASLVEYLVFAISLHQWGSPLALIAFPFAVIASNRARAAAMGWGDLVKAAFDVYLPELRKKLGLCDVEDSKKSKHQWYQFSQAIIYREPSVLPPRCVEQRTDSVTTGAVATAGNESEKKDERTEEDGCQSESSDEF